MKQGSFLRPALAASSVLVFAITVAAAAPAGAAGFCKLPDGSMGQQCVVASSGQVYGCVKDLKECGALSPAAPSGPDGAVSKGTGSPPAPAEPEGERLTKSRSNIQNN